MKLTTSAESELQRRPKYSFEDLTLHESPKRGVMKNV